MALFRQTGLICEDSIVHPQMNSVLNKKLETSGVDYPSNSWAKNVNIMAVMPTKTASGSLLTISDSADDVQLKEGKFNIDYNENGLSSMAITRCGKNIWGGETMANDTVDAINSPTKAFKGEDATGKFLSLSASWDINDIVLFSKFRENTQYTFIFKCSKNNTSKSLNVRIYYSNNTYTAVDFVDTPTADEVYTIAITTTAGKTVDRIVGFYGSGTSKFYYEDCGLFEGELTTSDFEAYSGDTYPVSFGTTIYGGYFESETGVLTSTKASDGTDLATPVEYQLSKVDVMLKSGLNNLFCTTGTSEVEYYTESSGGGVTPIFAATVLVDNSEAATSFTLSDDFEDYDFIAVEITSTSLGTIRIVTLPEVITEIFTYSSGKCCFDFWNSNNNCCYSHSGRTWTRTNNRYTNITKITGYKCTNATVTKTTVFAKQGISTTGGVITSQDSLFDYDYLFFATCSGDPTETQPCNTPISMGQKEIMQGATFVENKYNQLNTIYINEFDVTTWVNWFMCVGVSFS